MSFVYLQEKVKAVAFEFNNRQWVLTESGRSWPLTELAARESRPFYLYDLASLFHAHWNKGSENPALRFVKPEHSHLTIARLGLVAAVSCVLASGLAIIGADAPEQMR